MTYRAIVLSVTVMAGCGGPTPPQQPRAKGVEITVDVSGANPVISWSTYGSVRATQLTVTTPDCAYGPQKVLSDTDMATVTGGTERIGWWLLNGKDTKGEGFDGPVVYGSNVPGTTTNIIAHDIPTKCHLDITVSFPDQTVARKEKVKLNNPTNIANADADMKRLGYDKPWVSAKASEKPRDLPPPDAALQAEFAGRYELASIAGKALPKDYGNGCKMMSVWYDVAADGTYKSGYTMSCTTGPIDSKDEGTYGVSATTAVFSKDPASEPPATREAGGFTRQFGGEAYVFKKKS